MENPKKDDQKQPQQQKDPYGVPYQNKEERKASEFCNPCGVCCCSRCNLRVNCGIIAVFLTLLGAAFVLSMFTFTKSRLEVYNSTMCDNVTLFSPELMKEPGFCTAFEKTRLGAMVLSAGAGGALITTGISLLVAVAARRGMAAVVAGITCLVGFFLYIILIQFWVLINIKYPESTFSGRIKIDQLETAGAYDIGYWMFSAAVSIIMFCIGIWFSVCCFQLGRQIKAGVDRDPLDKPAKNAVQPQDDSTEPPAYQGAPSDKAIGSPAIGGALDTAAWAEAL